MAHNINEFLGEMEIEQPKTFAINWDTIKTVEDIVKIGKALNLEISWKKKVPELWKELHDGGYLIEITDLTEE